MSPIRRKIPLYLAITIAVGLGLLASCKPGRVVPPPQAATLSPTPKALPPRQSLGGIPDNKRVAEIMAMLSIEPTGLGKPITDRKSWAEFPNAKDLLNQALSNRSAPVPPLTDDLYLIYGKKGTRREYEDPASRRRIRLTSFVLAECIEDEGRFLPGIEMEMAAIFSERSWTLPAHDKKLESFNGSPIVDLGAADRAWILATADYLLGSKLKPETRATLRREITRRVLAPYREQVLGKAPGRAPWVDVDNNWNAVCHAGVIGAALALLPAPEERAWFLAAMELHLPLFLHGFSGDGYCSEGVGYWNYGFGNYAMLGQAAGNATNWGINLYSPDIVHNILTYAHRIELFPGLCPAFSDCNPTVKPSAWILQLAGVSGLKTPAQETTKVALYEAVAVAFPSTPPGSIPDLPTGLPLRDSFPIAGVMLCRTENTASGKGLAIAIKAGNNGESHNHNDLGSYVVAMNGRSILVDPGAEVYTARTFGPRRYESSVNNSYGHPVPVVAGKLQDTGAAARATITSVETSEARDVIVIDLAPAYRKSVPTLKYLTRTMTFTRSPEPSVEISDEVAFDSPQQFSTALITFGKSGAESPKSLVVSEEAESLSVKVDAGGLAFTVNNEVLEEKLPTGKLPLRIGIGLDEPVVRAKITCLIQPINPDDTQP